MLIISSQTSVQSKDQLSGNSNLVDIKLQFQTFQLSEDYLGKLLHERNEINYKIKAVVEIYAVENIVNKQ